MALVDNNINVVTIERDENRYKEAVSNISKMELDKRIKCVFGDALEVAIDGLYDLIFIDAAKCQNIKFFENLKEIKSRGGNVAPAFDGLAGDDSGGKGWSHWSVP